VLLNFQGPYRSELRDFVVGDAVLEFGGAIELGIAPVTAAFGSSFCFLAFFQNIALLKPHHAELILRFVQTTGIRKLYE